jgi:hypothetical protein
VLLPADPADEATLTAVDNPAKPAVVLSASGSVRARLRIAYVLLPLSVVLWAIGVAQTDPTRLGPYGLPAVLPVMFYVGLALLVVSASVEIARARPSRIWMALHSVVLVVILYGTAPLVYREGRYAWLYKTIGVVQYVNSHGQLDSHIDIYQNWPGLFAFAAWFDKVAGVASPLVFAKWAQLVFELAALPLLYLAYKALAIPARQRWIALLLYSASNTIGQDYFSPQALGTVLSLGIIALALRWMYTGNASRLRGSAVPRTARAQPLALLARELSRLRRHVGLAEADSHGLARRRAVSSPPTAADGLAMGAEDSPAAEDAAEEVASAAGGLATVAEGSSAATDEASRSAEVLAAGEVSVAELSRRRRAPLYLVLVVVFCVLTFTHQLSPYLVVAQLGVLALAGLVRPRWLPLALMGITFAYLLPRLTFVNSHYGLLSSLGHLFSNIIPPALASKTPLPVSQELIERSAELLTVGMWLLALVGAWMRRNSRRTVLTLVILSYSPILVLAAVPYGNEGILRVFLFSLPWAAALAAAVLAPLPSIAARHSRRIASLLDRGSEHASSLQIGLRVAAALGVCLALFLPAFFGDDRSNIMTQSEVDTVANFLQTAAPGPVFLPIDNAPTSDTRYNLFPAAQIFGTVGLLDSDRVTPDVASILSRMADGYTHRRMPAYVLITPSMIAYNEAYPSTPSGSFTILRNSLARSPDWKLVLDWRGSSIYEMPRDAPNPGPGPSGIGGFGVP